MTSIAVAVLVCGLLIGPMILRVVYGAMTSGQALGWLDQTAVTATSTLAVSVAIIGNVGVLVVPLALLGTAAAVVDVYEQRLPDTLTYPLAATTIAAAAYAGVGWQAAFGALLLGGIGLLGRRLRPRSLGWGDVKLLPGLGAALVPAGWTTMTPALTWWIVLLALTATLTRRSNLVPYGPALLIGTLGGLLTVI